MDRIGYSVKLYQDPSCGRPFSIESSPSSTLSHEANCTFFAPLHYEPGYAYPLLVWLHGRGEDEGQLVQIMPSVSIRNYVAMGPRGTCFSGAEGSGGGWYGWEQSEDQIQHAVRSIFDGIDCARREFHVARQRVFLAGSDCGGTMAFRVAMKHPDRFAGVLSLGGAFPSSCAISIGLDLRTFILSMG